MASAVYFRTSLRHNRTQRFREQKHWRNDQSDPQCVLRHANNAGLILSIFRFRPMFKQHVNLLI